jgi:hypothetical protein
MYSWPAASAISTDEICGWFSSTGTKRAFRARTSSRGAKSRASPLASDPKLALDGAEETVEAPLDLVRAGGDELAREVVDGAVGRADVHPQDGAAGEQDQQPEAADDCAPDRGRSYPALHDVLHRNPPGRDVRGMFSRGRCRWG